MKRLAIAAVAILTLCGGAAPSPPVVKLDRSKLKSPQPEKPSQKGVRELFDQGQLGVGAISPGGRYLALVRRDGKRDYVSILDLHENRLWTSLNTAVFENVKINWLRWKDEETLIAPVFAHTANGSFDYKLLDAAYALDVHGAAPVLLPRGSVVSMLRNDKDHILLNSMDRIEHGQVGIQFRSLLKVNVRDGATQMLEHESAEQNIDRTIDWATDRDGQPVIRYNVYGRHGGVRVMYRPTVNEKWEEFFVLRPKDIEGLPEFELLEASPDPGKFYVAANPQGKTGTRELHLYDFRTRTMSPKIWSHPKYDFSDALFSVDGAVEAYCFTGDTYACQFTDPTLEAEENEIEKFFDNDRNIVTVSASRDRGVRLLAVSGPDEPGSYYLYNRAKKTIEFVGANKPKLVPDSLGQASRFNYVARDDFSLSGYVTRPPNAGATEHLPMVVVPHGGPEARDYYDYDPWVQALVRAGYLVFQPNFRGSGGFGREMADAGYRQWGLRMQDDVLDGVDALIRQGQVDPSRICIYGASYGGYVALYAGARHPELFKCAVSRAGVADLVAMQQAERDLGADTPRYKYWLKAAGDPDKDRKQLIETSPVTYAADYGPPVLLLHGDKDDNVPIKQSKLMKAALDRAGRKVELKIYEGEDHSDWRLEDEVDAMGRIIEFVQTAIGPGVGAWTPPPAAAPKASVDTKATPPSP